jgi:hypothetical protein
LGLFKETISTGYSLHRAKSYDAGAPLQSKQHYLARAADMEKLAKESSLESSRDGFLKAAAAYRALAETAAKFGSTDPKPDVE